MQLLVAQEGLTTGVQAALQLIPDLARDLVTAAGARGLAVETGDVPVRDVDGQHAANLAVSAGRE